MTRRPLLGTLLFMAVFALAARGRADLPPPSDKKFVDYAFSVSNTKAFPDYVLLAFPWSLSNGAPTKEHALVEDGKSVSVGRRSSTPELYSMKRSDYDTWKAGYKATMEYDDPALDALFASEKVVRCNAKLSPEHLIAKDDPRNQVIEAFRVEAIDAKTCRLAKVDAKGDAPSTPKPSTPVGTATTEPTQPPNTPAPPQSHPRGCGGCTTERSNGESSFLIWASLAFVALARRRSASGTRASSS